MLVWYTLWLVWHMCLVTLILMTSVVYIFFLISKEYGKQKKRERPKPYIGLGKRCLWAHPKSFPTSKIMGQTKLNSLFTKQKSQQAREFKAIKKKGLKGERNSRVSVEDCWETSITLCESPSSRTRERPWKEDNLSAKNAAWASPRRGSRGGSNRVV